MCGNCCSGPEGFVRFSAVEGRRLAARLKVTAEVFERDYTQQTRAGRSLKEVAGPAGFDCIFLDRATIPGKAVCAVYEDRPLQCRTWPFWKSNLTDERAWRRAARTCPGIGTGTRHHPGFIRLTRDKVEI